MTEDGHTRSAVPRQDGGDASEASVIILGGGIAAAATAIGLSQLGIPCRVLALANAVARPNESFGENLSARAATPLRRLGQWETFQADSHRPCYTHRSRWGHGSRLAVRDSLTDPMGHGWLLDRSQFESHLREAAQTSGAEWWEGSPVRDIQRSGGEWRLTTEGATTSVIRAPFVVDATGRSSWFARRLGVKRILEDRQVAFVAALPCQGDGSPLIEATEDGWWYSAAAGRADNSRSSRPGDTLIVAFFTDPDLSADARTPIGWESRLQKAPDTCARTAACGDKSNEHSVTAVRVVAAGSGRLEQFQGEGWVAVGDAAMTYDPLAAHGITVALQSAADSAQAVATLLRSGDNSRLVQLSAAMEQGWSGYQSLRKALYRSEIRWPNRPYWVRRPSAE